MCRSDLVVSQDKARADSLFDKSLPGAGKGEAEGAKLFHRTSNVSIPFIYTFLLFSGKYVTVLNCANKKYKIASTVIGAFPVSLDCS